jgi:hypothetical protein
MVRSDTGDSRERMEWKHCLPVQGNKHSVKDTPDRVELMIRPSETGPHPSDLPQRHSRESIIKPAHPRPVDISRALIPQAPDQVEIPTHHHWEGGRSNEVHQLV